METTIVTLPPRRSDAVDIDRYRARALHGILRQAMLGAIALIKRSIKAVRDYRERRAAHRELSALDAQALHDMGINPGDIDAIVEGRFANDHSRCRKHVTVPLLPNPTPAASWRERARPGIRPALPACPESA